MFFLFTNKNHGNTYLRVLTTHFCVNTKKKNKINMWQIKVITEREKDLVYVALPEPENTLGQQVNSSSLITVKKYFSKDYRLFCHPTFNLSVRHLCRVDSVGRVPLLLSSKNHAYPSRSVSFLILFINIFLFTLW